MKEIWRPIKGLEGEYEASNFGRVRSIDRFITNPGNPNGGYRQHGKLLSACTAKNGYSVVNIGKRRGTKRPQVGTDGCLNRPQSRKKLRFAFQSDYIINIFRQLCR